MALVTASQVWKSLNMSPTDFGPEVIDPETYDTEEKQTNAAIAYVEAHILPGAISEVAVPVIDATNGLGIPLPDETYVRKYPSLSSDKIAYNSSVTEALYNDAIVSYARSEANKLVKSNSSGYDQDSDQDRKQADAKLEKLLVHLDSLINGPPVGEGASTQSGRSSSTDVSNSFVF